MPNDLYFDLSPTQYEFVTSDAHIVHLLGPMGEGKSHRKGTEVLMYDGSLRKVEDVRVGNKLMGDDSTPRPVFNLGHGVGPLYKIVPFRGQSFTVNGPHILSLKKTGISNVRRGKPTKTNHKGEIINISVDDYLQKSKRFKDTHKLYRVPVDFPEQIVDLDPYWLGLWLGDGNSHNPAITTPDREIVDYLNKFAHDFGIGITVNELKNNASKTYTFTDGNKGGIANRLTQILKKYDLLNNKHIPLAYRANSRKVRLKLLAGLIDSDGYRNRNSQQFTIKRKKLAEDIAYLARSLGFAAYINKVTKTIKSMNFSGEYYQIGISGDLSVVPVRIPRKKCRPRAGEPFKNVLVTGIKEIIPQGEGEYFGFNLGGNHLFLLGDFTVTHNTFAGVAGLIAHARRCRTNIRSALVRDTFQNIKTSTIPDIRDYLGSWVQFSDGNKKMVINSNPRVECDLFGIDDEASISKLQGPQYACIWLEEPAPIFEKANAGLPREVFNLSLARAARQRGTIPRVQITQNPADEDHWTSVLADEPDEYMTIQDEATGEWITIQKRTFWIPRGENKHLSTITRAANMAAFKDDPAKWQRYIEGETATIQLGKKVTPGYGKIHFSDRILPVFPSEAIQLWDGWHHPSCIIAQYNPFGQLIFHDCFSDDEKTATKELVEEQIDPLLSTPKYKDKIPSWRIIGDSTMRTADQSSIRSSAAGYLEKRFNSHFEPGPVHWHNLREPLNQCFHRLVSEGRPAVMNSRSAVKLHRALKGGWHYKTDNSGHVIGDKPVQDEHCHLGMAFAYGISILMPYDPRKKLKKVSKRIRQKRAMSYRGGNFSRDSRVINPSTGFM